MWPFREDPVPRIGELSGPVPGSAVSYRRHTVEASGLRISMTPGTVAVMRFGDRTVAVLSEQSHEFSHTDIRYLCDGDPDPILETWFVDSGTLGPVHFGGEIDDAALVLNGEMAVTVTDAGRLIETLGTRVDLPNWEALSYWISKQALHSARRVVQGLSLPGQVAPWQVAAQTAELEADTTAALHERLARHGLAPVGELMLVLTAAATCGTCSTAVPRWARYCPACGASLVSRRRCRSCQAPALPAARYCTECGAMLDEYE